MTNIALNKPALQSSTSPWSTDKAPDKDARNANNGDFASKKVFHTGREAYPWWQVDLEDAFIVDNVKITNWKPTAERLTNFTILTSLDGKCWKAVHKKADGAVFGKDNDEPYVCKLTRPVFARFIRLRLDTTNYLNFRECQVFGRRPTREEETDLRDVDAAEACIRHAIPQGRSGFVSEFDDLAIFVDTETYSAPLIGALKGSHYEHREREAAKAGLRPGDRVLEAGTAIGVVTMTMASIVGAANVATFDANPLILEDAKQNFRRNGFEAIRVQNGFLKNRAAMANSSKAIKFNISRDFVSSRFSNGVAADTVKTVSVPVFCLEEEIRKIGANILALDIEGGEVELLRGADLSAIRVIIMETHYHFAGTRETDEMIADLYRQGFSIDLAASGHQVVLMRR